MKIDKRQLNKLKSLHKRLYNVKEILANTNGKDKYAFAPCFVGKNYLSQNRRLMIIGQNSNGWDRDDGKFSNADEYAEYIVNTYIDPTASNYEGFNWIETLDNTGYHINSSSFWKPATAIYKSFSGLNDVDIWQHYTVQSDTMKITYHKNSIGNVVDKDSSKNELSEITVQKDISLKILLQEIEILKPTHILFMTNDNADMYFFSTLNERFGELPKEFERDRTVERQIVKRFGMIGDSKCIVTIHPSGLYVPGNQIEKYIKEIDRASSFMGWDFLRKILY